MQHYGSSIIVTNSINTTQIHTEINTAANYKQMLHDTEFMNVTSLDEKLQPWAAENLLKDIGKVEGIETNPLNPENISNTAVEELIPETLSNINGKNKKGLSITQEMIEFQSNRKKNA